MDSASLNWIDAATCAGVLGSRRSLAAPNNREIRAFQTHQDGASEIHDAVPTPCHHARDPGLYSARTARTGDRGEGPGEAHDAGRGVARPCRVQRQRRCDITRL